MNNALAAAYYAFICGVLAALAPNFGNRLWRAVWGMAVGVAAVFVLPFIRAAIGN